ncbi:MAG: hypothetical protein LBL93_02060, partial [Ruminococcus sp.]|nr:hypothetical protein [Ruminococcus sp.]
MSKISLYIRLLFLVLLVVSATITAGMQLMKIQIVDAEKWTQTEQQIYSAKQVIGATRGKIVDNDGVAIIENSVGFNVIIEKAYFPSGDKEENKKGNEVLLKLVNILKQHNLEYKSFFPENEKELSEIGLNSYATEENAIDKLCDDYDIEGYNDESTKAIAGLRFAMLEADFSVGNAFIMSENIPQELVVAIKEQSLELPGVNIGQSPLRVYKNPDILPHEIGTIGPIYAEEYSDLK